MIRYFRKLLFFTIGLFLSYILLVLFIAISSNYTEFFEKFSFGNTDTNGFSFQRSNDFNGWISKNSNKKKNLIIGSSTAYRNIIPDSLNTSSASWFNLGSSLQTLDITYVLLEKITSEHVVDFVLLDYYPSIEMYSNFESSLDLIKNSVFNNQIKLGVLKNSDFHLKLFNQFGYQFVKNYFGGKTHLKPEVWSGTYVSDGFVAMENEKPISKPKFERLIQLNESGYLKSIISLLKERKIPFVINVAPSLGIDYDLTFFFPGEKKIYSKEIFLNNNINHFFYDTHHMTLEGARIYSSKIKENLYTLITP
jgi:hypothetical protein